MSRLHDAFERLAADAPEVRLPPRLYAAARRRHRLRWAAASAVVLLVAALAVWYPVRSVPVGPAAPPDQRGLPTALETPPWWTASASRSPAGAAAVVFSEGKTTVGSDFDPKIEWWRPGSQNVATSVVVGLERDSYRIARVGYWTGVELSPDGRYLMSGPDILDLVTGATITVPPLVDDAEQYGSGGAWSADGRHIVFVHKDTVAVLAWPGLRVEWRMRIEEEDTDFVAIALSPDGSMLATQSAEGLLTVVRSDGSRVWSRQVGPDRLAGRAAWRVDGRLAIVSSEPEQCPVAHVSRLLTLVDALTGTPVPDAFYPRVFNATALELVAWRDGSAYAVVTTDTDCVTGESGRVALIRLDPDALLRQVLLTAPPGTEAMGVATDHLGTTRATGRPQNGVDVVEVLGRSASGLACLFPGLLVYVLAWRKRRARVRR